MKVGVLGCGKMCSAMVHRWLQVGLLQPTDVLAMTRTEASAARVSRDLGVDTCQDARELLRWADVVLLGIKPQQARETLAPLRDHVDGEQLWLSVLAGVEIATLEELTGASVVRLMPNTPVRLGAGATGVVWGAHDDRRDAIMPLLEALGVVAELEEEQLDGFTALAGSGPAYVFYFLEALESAGVHVGLEQRDARSLALSVLEGAAALMGQAPRPPAALRKDVTSPGGMTQAAISSLQRARWAEALAPALAAAVHRGRELANSATEADQ